MRHLHAMGLTALILAGAGPRIAAQQTEGLKVGATLPLALDGLKSYTNNSLLGLCLEAQYQMRVPGSGTFLRAGLGAGYFPGHEKDGVKISLTNIQITGDAVFPILQSRYSFVTGLSVNDWMKSSSGSRDGVDYSSSGTVKHAFTKLGFRMGFEGRITARWSATAMLQVTELGLDSEFKKDPAYPNYGEWNVLPSWIQVGVKYAF